jgi:dynein heavy chain
MDADLDAMSTSLLNNEVPGLWAKVAYPSLKPLASWREDLLFRCDFFQTWIKHSHPSSYPIAAFFFPQGFMTGVLQTFARKYNVAIDSLNFGFEVMKQETGTDITEWPEDGVFVYGLFFDSARWDREERVIKESHLGEMYAPMPVIHFQPVEDYVTPEGRYSAPLYKTLLRAGVLSTTGQSTNYVLSVDIPTDRDPNVWVKQASALMCALRD